MRLRISSRQSDLARIQAYLVGEALKKNFPQIEIEFLFRESLGDKNFSDPLWKMPEKGVFTEDFYGDLVEGRTDLVVHSWKDLPTDGKPDTIIAATLPRADQRDLLLFKKSSLNKKPQKIRIFSSSPRRAYNLNHFFSEVMPFELKETEFLPVRGNVQTRVRKLMEASDVDGLIVAKAALDRLLSATQEEFRETRNFLRKCLQDLEWMVLPLRENPNAAAQGALAIEINKNREDLKDLLSKINCTNSFECAEKERVLLSSYGGGCHQKIGVFVVQHPQGRMTGVRGETPQGETIDRLEWESQKTIPWNKLRPYLAKEESLRERQSLPVQWPEKPHAFWIARAEAWPEGKTADTPLWAAGIKTWKKLAQQGIWVHGCSEGWGESFLSDLTALVGESLPWARLTHADAPVEDGFLQISTYKIVHDPLEMNLQGENFFFWKSGSHFLNAIQRYPQLKNEFHACGPGRTYQIIAESLNDPHRVFVFLSEEHWRESCQKEI